MEEQNKTTEENNPEQAVSAENVSGDVQQNAPSEKNKNEGGGNKEGNDNFIAALSYLGLLILIPILTKKDDEFVQFHIKQGIILLIVWFVGMVVFMIPIFGQLAALALLVVTIIAFVKALNGDRWEIPVVADWAKKINL